MLDFVFALLLASLLLPSSSLDTKYEDAQLDLIILMDRSGSIAAADYAKMLNFIEQLPTAFPLGQKKTQMALVTFDTNAEVIFTLTGNVDIFQNKITELRKKSTGGFTSTHIGLKTIEENVLPYDPRFDVTNVVLIVTDGCTNPHPDRNKDASTMAARQEAEDRAAKLRADGAIIFLVHVGQDRCEMASEDHQLNLVGGIRENWVQIENFDELTSKIFDTMQKQLIIQLCSYKKFCYYQDNTKSQCLGDWRRSPSASSLPCDEKKPPVTVPECEINECRVHCDRMAKESGEKCKKYCHDQKSVECLACRHCLQLEAPVIGGTILVPVVDPEYTRREGLYIGVGIGAVLLLLLLLVLAIVIIQRRRKAKREKMMMDMKASIYEKGQTRGSMSRKGGISKGDAYKTLASVGSFGPSRVTTGPGHRLAASAGEPIAKGDSGAAPKTGPAYQLTTDVGGGTANQSAPGVGFQGQVGTVNQRGPAYRLTTAVVGSGGVAGRDSAAFDLAAPGRQAGVGVSLTTAVGGGTGKRSVAGRDSSAADLAAPGRQAGIGVSLTTKASSVEVKRSAPEATRFASRSTSRGKRRPHSRTIGHSKEKRASHTVKGRR